MNHMVGWLGIACFVKSRSFSKLQQTYIEYKNVMYVDNNCISSCISMYY